MTEADWLGCTTPEEVEQFLRGRGNERQLRLFAVACCRRIWDLFLDQRCRDAVVVAERFADGQAMVEELEAALNDAVAVQSPTGLHYRAWAASFAACRFVTQVVPAPGDLLFGGRVVPCWSAAKYARWASRHAGRENERGAQAILLADILGGAATLRVDPNWVSWNNGMPEKMAKAIYNDRCFNELPVLGDVLEEAGCDDRVLLDHCRGPGPHARGCWVVDRILNLERA